MPNVQQVGTLLLRFGQCAGVSNAVQQCVAADEAGAGDGASQLNADVRPSAQQLSEGVM